MPRGKDNGQEALEMDVKVLLSNVIDKHFHDFQSEVSATPKLYLEKSLQQLIKNMKAGKYDNAFTK